MLNVLMPLEGINISGWNRGGSSYELRNRGALDTSAFDGYGPTGVSAETAWGRERWTPEDYRTRYQALLGAGGAMPGLGTANYGALPSEWDDVQRYITAAEGSQGGSAWNRYLQTTSANNYISRGLSEARLDGYNPQQAFYMYVTGQLSNVPFMGFNMGASPNNMISQDAVVAKTETDREDVPLVNWTGKATDTSAPSKVTPTLARRLIIQSLNLRIKRGLT